MGVSFGIILLGAIYLFLWFTQIKSPTLYSTADFIAFYAAGQVAQKEGATQVYDLEKQYQVEQSVSNRPFAFEETYPYNHIPYLIPLLEAITSSNYTASFTRWALLLITVAIGGVVVLMRSLPHTKDRILTAIGLFLFFPSIISIIQGQDSVILLLGAALWMDGLLHDRDKEAGLGLALITVRPHIALLLAIPTLMKRKQAFVWFEFGGILLAVLSFLLIGINGTRDFIHRLTLSSRGTGFQMQSAAMFNTVGILSRWLPSISPDTLEIIGWALFLVAIIVLAFIWHKSNTIDERHITAAIIISILAAPHLHYHDLALLLLPITVFLRIENKLGIIRLSLLTYLPLTIAGVLFINHYLPNKFILPYLLMLALLTWAWRLQPRRPKNQVS
ncbi:MAG: glycosyltransferase 87 family protein [Anaerolineales bacterium]|nr:glycosyltransferase 87 family protein [Anaerolineales bacterium]